MRKLSWFLIIIGSLVILSPLIGKAYNSYVEKQLIEEWRQSESTVHIFPSQQPDPEETTSPQKNYDKLEEVFVKKDDKDNKTASLKSIKNKQKVLGVIKIQKIDVNYPIVEGVKKDNLRVGIGHIPGTAALGQKGNCVLAGHRNYAFSKFFNRLNELKAKDIITLVTKGAEYRYEVYAMYVVSPKDISVLRAEKNRDILTLITCTPPNTSLNRLIVQAKLVDN